MNTNKTITQIGIILVLVIMPLAIGIPLFLANRDRPEFLEIPLAIFGVFELLVLTVRIQVRDNKKRKAGNHQSHSGRPRNRSFPLCLTGNDRQSNGYGAQSGRAVPLSS